MNRQRNSLLELWRFLASVLMAAYHFEWVYIGSPVYLVHFYIWVEFFFVLSGFFLAQNVTKKTETDEMGTIKYVARQFIKFYPLYLAAFFMSFTIANFALKTPLRNYLKLLWEAKWEALLCTMTGYDNLATIYNAGGAPAYISSLLICSLLLHYMIKHHSRAYVNVIGPIGIIWGISRIINYYGNLSQWMAIDSIGINIGIIRGIADMSVGAVSGLLVKSAMENSSKDMPFKKKKTASIIGFSLLVLVTIALVILRNQIVFKDLIFFIFIFALAVTFIHIGHIEIDGYINRALLFLGKLSYPIFLFHYCVLIWLKNYMPGMSYGQGLVVALCIILGISIVAFYIQAIISKKYYMPQK